MSDGIIQGTVQIAVTLDGVSVSSLRQCVADNIAAKAGVLAPIAKAGTVSNQSSRILTSTAHGIADTETLAIFWTDAGVAKRRYGLTIASVADDTITLDDSGAGDALPVNATVIAIAVAQVVDDLSIKAADLVQAIAKGDYAGLVTWHAADDDAVIRVSDLTTEKLFDHWPTLAPGEEACFSEDIGSVTCYNASTVYTSRMYAIASVDPDLSA